MGVVLDRLKNVALATIRHGWLHSRKQASSREHIGFQTAGAYRGAAIVTYIWFIAEYFRHAVWIGTVDNLFHAVWLMTFRNMALGTVACIGIGRNRTVVAIVVVVLVVILVVIMVVAMRWEASLGREGIYGSGRRGSRIVTRARVRRWGRSRPLRVLRIRPRLGGVLEAIAYVFQIAIVVIVLVLLLLGVVVPIGHRLVGAGQESVKKFFSNPARLREKCETTSMRSENVPLG